MNWIVTYILVWPVLSAGVLILLIGALVRDWRVAKRDGKEMI